MARVALLCVLVLLVATSAYAWTYKGYASADCSGTASTDADCKAGQCCEITVSGSKMHVKGECTDGALSLQPYTDSSCVTKQGDATSVKKADMDKCKADNGASFKATCSPASSFYLMSAVALLPFVVAMVC